MVKEDKIRELEQIIKGKKLRTHFQPIISLKTGKILGYEALTRGPGITFINRPIDYLPMLNALICYLNWKS